MGRAYPDRPGIGPAWMDFGPGRNYNQHKSYGPERAGLFLNKIRAGPDYFFDKSYGPTKKKTLWYQI
jgi:hypothetical protein